MIVKWFLDLTLMALGQLLIWFVQIYEWLAGVLIVVCSIAIVVEIIRLLLE